MNDAQPTRPDLGPKAIYSRLNGKQQEIYNFQKVAGVLADWGFNCIKLADDWQGADFIAHRKNPDMTLFVQLKGRPDIQKKYLGKHLHIAFPIGSDWYLVDHDDLVNLVGANSNALNTDSWLIGGAFNWPAPPPKWLVTVLEPFKLQ